MGFFDGAIMWVIGLLVVSIIAVSVVIPSTLTAIASVETQGTNSAELWNGTAATAHAMAAKPIVAVSVFKKAALVTSYNDTALVGANGSRNVMIDSYAAVDGVAWNNINITLTIAGVNGTTNTTWVGGTCSPGGYNTTPSSSPYNLEGAASTCLTPGANVLFTFVNRTTAGEEANNVTNVSISYWRYVDNTAYTLQTTAGTITPTASGYYYTTYTYGTAGTGTAVIVLNMVPLMIGVVLLLLVITSATWMQGL